MYICQCNAMTDHDIRDAIAEGARTPADVYIACGCCVQCGSCTGSVARMIEADDRARQPQQAEACAA